MGAINGGHAVLWSDGMIIDLGSLCGGCRLDFAEATDINDVGQIVGDSTTPNGVRGFLWQNGSMTVLPPLAGDAESRALAINNLGHIVGGSDSHAVMWIDGQPRNLGALPGGYAFAYDINDADQVVGESMNRGFLWQAGVMTDLGPAAGSCRNFYTLASAINRSGVVSGVVPFDCHWHAAIWANGTIQDLGTLIGPTGTSFSDLHGINDVGEVAVTSETQTSCQYRPFHAALGSAAAVVDLGTLAAWPCASSFAYGINNHSVVAGLSDMDAGPYHAVLFSVESPDTEPPLITVSAGTSSLWPPNGKMVPVTFSGSITDDGSGVADATFAVTDEYGLVQPSGPVIVGGDGSYHVTVLLEARRQGEDKNGRTYTMVVTATDKKGNRASASAKNPRAPRDSPGRSGCDYETPRRNRRGGGKTKSDRSGQTCSRRSRRSKSATRSAGRRATRSRSSTAGRAWCRGAFRHWWPRTRRATSS